MKRVHSPAMIAHLWANQSQSDARNATNSFYFIGATIYSYGRHFPIAHFLPDGRVLWNDCYYSNSTSKHQMHVKHALPGYNIGPGALLLNLTHVSDFSAGNLAALAEKQATYFIDLIATKTRESRQRSEWIASYNARMNALDYFSGITNPRVSFEITPKLFSAQTVTRNAELARLKREKDIARLINLKLETRRDDIDFVRACKPEFLADSKLLRKFNKTYKKLKAEFHAGEHFSFPHIDTCALLRIEEKVIVTSRGAEVPLAVAPVMWRAVKQCRDTKRAYVPDSRFIVGSFELAKIDESGTAFIDCHKIEFSEFSRLAMELGYV